MFQRPCRTLIRCLGRHLHSKPSLSGQEAEIASCWSVWLRQEPWSRGTVAKAAPGISSKPVFLSQFSWKSFPVTRNPNACLGAVDSVLCGQAYLIWRGWHRSCMGSGSLLISSLAEGQESRKVLRPWQTQAGREGVERVRMNG